MAHLELTRVTRRFGAFTALADVDLAVGRGEFVVLLGPSGCGKTTLLRVVAGLERQDAGRIVHAGEDISLRPPGQRDYGIVFQSYALFPNLDVARNVGYGLDARRAARAATRQRVQDMLELVGLAGSDTKYPAQLSGGQQQRIALARALAPRPDLLLLDEPLSALDAIERVRLRTEIRALQQRLGVTTLMVTHDQEEALCMADRIVVMHQGRIQQTGTPQQVYHQPANAFVADFIGRGNLVDAVAADTRRLHLAGLELCCATALQPGRRYRFNVRPEDIRLVEAGQDPENRFTARVERCEFLGASSLVSLLADAAADATSAGRPAPRFIAQFGGNYLAGRTVTPGATLQVCIPPECLLPLPEAA